MLNQVSWEGRRLAAFSALKAPLRDDGRRDAY